MTTSPLCNIRNCVLPGKCGSHSVPKPFLTKGLPKCRVTGMIFPTVFKDQLKNKFCSFSGPLPFSTSP